jgi:hypothetical protein
MFELDATDKELVCPEWEVRNSRPLAAFIALWVALDQPVTCTLKRQRTTGFAVTFAIGALRLLAAWLTSNRKPHLYDRDQVGPERTLGGAQIRNQLLYGCCTAVNRGWTPN